MPLCKRNHSQIRSLVRRITTSQFSTSSQFTSVYSFGDNSSGALALSTPLLDAFEPTKITNIPSTSSITSIEAGHYHSLAINSDGDVFAWGRNVENQLGRGLDSSRDTWNQPAKVVGMQNAHAAFASGVVSAAIKDDGSLWVWGRSKRGQLGLGIDVTNAIKPSKVDALSDHEIVKDYFVPHPTYSPDMLRWRYRKRYDLILRILARIQTNNSYFQYSQNSLKTMGFGGH